MAGQLNVTGQNNALGGFYSFSLDNVYKLKDAVTNAPYIDMVYYYGATNAATLATMSDPILYDQTKGPAGIKEVMPQFQVRNATKFAVVTEADFTAATADVFPKSTDLTATSKNKLSVGDYLAFQTVLGDKGFIKVVEIMGTTQETRAIKLDVKVLDK